MTMDDKAYPVVELDGAWPEWFGKIGMRFIYIRIRHGDCTIGVGSSHNEAFERASTVEEANPDLVGVTEVDDAVWMLRKHGYRVESIVVPAHVERV
jgi:hypothetical protein